jgi:hypothetical protein
MKIYGIGLPKTGTSSLVAALRILGYKTERLNKLLDHPDNMYDWAKVKSAMRGLDAGVDEMLYLQLENLAAVKSAKFIMTTRPLDEWKSSVKWYYNSSFPDWWLTYVNRPWEDVFVEYHTEAPALLGDRLLVFDPASGWEPLCSFLGKNVPKKKFPHINKGAT